MTAALAKSLPTPMQLHVPTIFVALFFSFVLFVAALTFTRPILGAGAELRLWVRSVWLLLASFVALFSRVFMPEWFAVLFGNGLIFASLYLMSQALHRFVLAQDAPRWNKALMLLGWVGTALVMNSPLPVRTVVISCLIAAQLAPMVWLMLTRGWQAETALRTVGITLTLTWLSLLLRVANAIVRPEDYSGYFQTSLGNGVTYLASFLFPLGAGYGFVLANLERTAHRLDALATHDGMTGCLNRGAFDTLMGNALQRVRRDGTPASLIALDLDNFKQINDTRGHPTGDAVLQAFAHTLRDRLRAADALGRLGGDEFAVLLSDTDAAGALTMAEVLRTTAEALEIPTPDGERLRITVSIGVATATPDSLSTVEALHAAADKSLYAAKQGGRNQAVRLEAGSLQAAGRGNTLATG
ncbi:MAG: GGDEF domain-containing protein [Rhizobacter sp.]|nr:GGDEF domain-containing protein [Rhizobacter sp.]